jgi:hypothetical protein
VFVESCRQTEGMVEFMIEDTLVQPGIGGLSSAKASNDDRLLQEGQRQFVSAFSFERKKRGTHEPRINAHVLGV